MVFQASDYVIWMVFVLLETLAFRFATKPEHRPFRAFMGLCLIRDFILLTWSCHLKYYWAICWIGLEIEWVIMALVVGGMIGKGRPWRVPAFTIAIMAAHYALTDKWPILARPEEIFHFERTCCLIIIGTLLIGAVFTFEKHQLPLAGSMAILAGSDIASAQSYLSGNYSPMTASVVWALGLGILVAALRANPERWLRLEPVARAASVSTTETRSIQPPQQSQEAKLLDEFSRLKEWTTWPCHTQVQ